LLAQGASGLFADDHIIHAGNLARFVENTTRSLATWLHGKLGYIITAMVLVHIGAVLPHVRMFRESLLATMVTGRKRVTASTPEITESYRYSKAVGLVCLAVAVVATVTVALI
jgi:cytochrome b